MIKHIQDNWPAIVVGAAWLTRESRVLWNAGFDLAEYFMAHGGVKNFLKKLWNGGAQ